MHCNESLVPFSAAGLEKNTLKKLLLHNTQTKNMMQFLIIISIVFSAIVINIVLIVSIKVTVVSAGPVIPSFSVRARGSSLLGRPRARSWFCILGGPRARTRLGLGTRLPWFGTRFRTWSGRRSFSAWTSGTRTTILFLWWPWVAATSFARWTGAGFWATTTRRSGPWAAIPE